MVTFSRWWELDGPDLDGEASWYVAEKAWEASERYASGQVSVMLKERLAEAVTAAFGREGVDELSLGGITWVKPEYEWADARPAGKRAPNLTEAEVIATIRGLRDFIGRADPPPQS